MPARPLPQPVVRARLRRGAITAALISAAAAIAPGPARAALIPAPGPWPTNVSGATNPLLGTPLALNGTNATANAQLRVWLPSARRRLTTVTRTVGQATVVRGQLRSRDTKLPIGAATLTVAIQNVYAPTEWTAITTVHTNRNGDLRTVIGPGYHRRVALLYYPTATATSPIFSRRLLIRAKSRVMLRRPVHTGRRYRFDGQVSAGAVPVPPAGLLIALQVRNRSGKWITARLRRTTASGRFRIRYTFTNPAALKIRIAVPAQSGWALYAGYSARRSIHP